MHVSVGLDALDSTQAKGNAPDGNFVSTRLRAQWARRIDFLDSQFISRFDGQFANRALLGMEQMTLGGRWSIRGYRENTLIRDNGLIGSLEWRVPIFVEAAGRVVLEVGPFVDLSYSWNTNRGEIGPNELNSAGLGSNWRPSIAFTSRSTGATSWITSTIPVRTTAGCGRALGLEVSTQ